MGIEVPPGKIGQLLRGHAKRLPGATMRGAKMAAYRAARDLIKASMVGVTGQFRQAWRPIDAPHGITVYNDAPYAGIIERGARPHGVSKEGQAAIKQWAMRKLGVDEKAADSITFAICKRIREQGVKPRWLVKDRLDKFMRDLENEVMRQAEKEFTKPPGG